jgi:hypothetical protein
MATTYLQLVNDVLTRLREPTVASVTENDYSSLIGKLVNDAKREVEDAWNWECLRSTITVTTSATTSGYTLTGSGDRFRFEQVYNDTMDYTLEHRPTKFFNDALILTANPKSGEPYYYGTNGVDSSGDLLVRLFPIPDAIYSVKFSGFEPEAELSSGSDTTKLSKAAIVALAWAKAIEERGEDGGVNVSSQYAVAKQALADAIAIEAGRRADEVNWYWS